MNFICEPVIKTNFTVLLGNDVSYCIQFRKEIGRFKFNQIDGDIDRTSYTQYKVDDDGIPR